MMSSMFEIPILYVACDVKIVKKEGVIFLLTCTSKNTVTKEIHVLAGFFFRKKTRSGREQRSRRETNRTESKLFLFKNLINYYYSYRLLRNVLLDEDDGGAALEPMVNAGAVGFGAGGKGNAVVVVVGGCEAAGFSLTRGVVVGAGNVAAAEAAFFRAASASSAAFFAASASLAASAFFAASVLSFSSLAFCCASPSFTSSGCGSNSESRSKRMTSFCDLMDAFPIVVRLGLIAILLLLLAVVVVVVLASFILDDDVLVCFCCCCCCSSKMRFRNCNVFDEPPSSSSSPPPPLVET